jgi:gliding motility-associated-like protein
MKYFISLIVCFLSINAFAQSEAANWYFGFGAGIKFNQANGTVTSLDDGSLITYEGCTSISDDTGNLLFYTDGTTIWNKNHDVMAGGLLGDSSSTQSAIIVPKPDDSTIYYVFTVGSQFNNTGLHYSVVDITLNNGLGGVTSTNTRLLNVSSEKITAVLKDCISKSMWVVSFASVDGNSQTYNTFHAFEVSVNGVNDNSVKSTFPINITDPRGYLKLSPDGTKMACANFTSNDTNNFTADRLFLYDFNTATGIVSNPVSLSINSQNNFPYGLEFSPNSQLLYVHASNAYQSNSFDLDDDATKHRSSLAQFDLTQTNIQSSQVIIDDRQLYRGGLQLGPDGRIYRALTATYQVGLPYLGVINNPNEVGTASNYQHNAINLSPNQSSQGLPPFIQSLFNTQIDIIKNGKSNISLALCEGDSYQLTSENLSGATYTWTKDKIALPDNTFDLTVTSSGHYEVLINPNNGDCEIEGQAYVLFNPNPMVENKTLIQCDEDDLKDGITTFNLTEAYKHSPSEGTTNLKYNFFQDLAGTVELNGNSYKNTSNPQIVYVKATNLETDCFSFSELTLAVSLTDVNDTVLPAVCDDDGIEDGLHIFNLVDANAEILNGITNIDLDISYYETYEDALLESKELGAIYTNTQPYFQTIFARVENSNACYGISEVDLIVNKLPNIELTGREYYCLNKSPEYITLEAGIINDSPNNYNYLWSNGDTNYQTQVNAVGEYTVTVTSKISGCSKTKTIIVESSNTATFKEINVIDVSENNTVTVLVTGEGIYNYALYDAEKNIYKPYQESNVFEGIFPGFYHVYVKDIENNCGVVNKPISVIGYPKFFTPNNDGVNDTWQIIGVSDMFQSDTNITIYDRFGKLIKQLDPLGEGWNGLFNGQKLPSDDYWFSVKLQDGRIFKNHFTLKN